MKILLLATAVAVGGFALNPSVTPMNSRVGGGGGSPTDSTTTIRAEIVRMMDSAAAAWNKGDLDRFMEDYAPDTTTTFIGSKEILRGRAAIKAAYAPRFAPGGVRDSLSFENLEIDVLAKDVVNTIAYYRLMRGDSTIARGPTSLVMRKINGRWLIIHDHSS